RALLGQRPPVALRKPNTMCCSLNSKRLSERALGGEAAHRLSRVSSPTSSRAASLRELLEQHIVELFATLRPLSQEQWALLCPREGWPVGYFAHHIGQGIARPTGWIEQALAGDDPFDFTWEVTHEL